MGYSVNDRIRFGGFAFDLQVEAVGDRVIGEIISNGKVLKKLTLPLNGRDEREVVSEVFSRLKELLLSRVKEKAVKKAIYLREKLSELFDVEEEQIRGFLLYVPALKEPVRCMKGELTGRLEEWLSSLEEAFLKKFTSYRPEVLTMNYSLGGEEVLVIFVRDGKEGVRVVSALSGVKLSLIRKKLNRETLQGVVRSVLKS